MQCYVTPELLAYLRKKKKMNIVVDVATSNTSDFEVSEIFYRLADDRGAEYLIQKKRFRAVSYGEGDILLPSYHLVYDETVTFSLKKTWLFHSIRAEGIEL